MPRTSEDVETFLLSLDRRFENDGGTLLVYSGHGLPPIAVRVDPPIIAFRVAIGPVPPDADHQARMFRRLLEYNATDLVHASYGIADGTVVLTSALELENLDRNELEAVLSDMDLALARHVAELRAIARSPEQAS